MNEILIANHNKVVGKDDICWFLGDFCLGPVHRISEVGQRLNGRKILIFGNHDRPGQKGMEEYAKVFEEVHKDYMYTDPVHGEVYLRHIPDARRAVHVPLFLHGHIHTLAVEDKTEDYHMINLSVDCWNFAPQTLDAILAEATGRQAKLKLQLTAEQANVYREDRIADRRNM